MTNQEYSNTNIQEGERVVRTLEESAEEKSNLTTIAESSEDHREFFDRFKSWEQIRAERYLC